MFVPDLVLGPALCLSRKSWAKQVAVLVCVICSNLVWRFSRSLSLIDLLVDLVGLQARLPVRPIPLNYKTELQVKVIRCSRSASDSSG